MPLLDDTVLSLELRSPTAGVREGGIYHVLLRTWELKTAKVVPCRRGADASAPKPPQTHPAPIPHQTHTPTCMHRYCLVQPQSSRACRRQHGREQKHRGVGPVGSTSCSAAWHLHTIRPGSLQVNKDPARPPLDSRPGSRLASTHRHSHVESGSVPACRFKDPLGERGGRRRQGAPRILAGFCAG